MAEFVDHIAPKESGIIHRGMCHDEYVSVIKKGFIQSKGSKNVGDEQEGLTYFSKEPYAAGMYAQGMKDEIKKPVYVVSVKKPPESKIKGVPGVAKHEVGVKGKVTAKDIVAIYKAEPKKDDVDWKQIQEETIPEMDLYHGSGHLFKHFDSGKARIKNDLFGGGAGYLTNNHDVAKGYAKAGKKATGQGYIYHVKAKMKNTFDVDHDFSGEHVSKMLPDDVDKFARGAGLMKFGTDRIKVLSDLKSGKTGLKGHQIFNGLSDGGVNTYKAREHLKKHGYDSLRYNGGNITQGVKHDVYIPYDSGSMKIHKITRLVDKK